MISRKTWLKAMVGTATIAAYSAQSIAGATTAVDGTSHGIHSLAPLQLPSPTALPPPDCAPIGPVRVFCSAEVDDATQDSHQRVDTLDDSWRSAMPGSKIVVGRIKTAELPTVVGGMFNSGVSVSLRNVSAIDLANPLATGAANEKQGYADVASDQNMQEEAPKPACLVAVQAAAWNEEAGKRDSRNAVLFAFEPPARAFGAWFGDLETRSDGKGTPAVLRLFDAQGQPLGRDSQIPSTTPNQDACRQDVAGCGNQTTRWIGFLAEDSAPVAAMLVVVGDDDPLDVADGKEEHLGFIGPTVAYSTLPSATAVPIARPGLPVKLHFPLLPRGLRVDPRLAEDVCAG
jgi:hypothetical protein